MQPSTSDLLAKLRARSKLFSMDIFKMLTELRTEHTRIQEAIDVLERLARGGGKRRGRPPAWMKQPTQPESYKRAHRESRKRHVSAEARKRMAAAQKRRWAARRHAANA